MGMAATYYCAKSGAKTLAIDQFEPPHESGSHTGESRIIRMAYFEHPDYVPLLKRAYSLWAEIENLSSQKLFFKSGLSYFGNPDGILLKGVKKSANEYNVPILQNEEVPSYARSDVIHVPEHFECIFEENAGYVVPEKTISTLRSMAKRQQAEFLFNEQVIDIDYQNEDVIVKTKTHAFSSKKVIITAGAWTSRLLPYFEKSLTVTQQSLFWLKAKDSERFKVENFPCWNITPEGQAGLFYGFPLIDNLVKIAYHHPSIPIDPDHKEIEAPNSDRVDVNSFIDQYMPQAFHKIVKSKTCLYTNSTDENFIIDFLPDSNNKVIIGCGFSGHGFKFVPVVGEILCNMALEGIGSKLSAFLSLSRF